MSAKTVGEANRESELRERLRILATGRYVWVVTRYWVEGAYTSGVYASEESANAEVASETARGRYARAELWEIED